ncbi:MAG TPA: hypothetical protein VFZ34_30540 [Blastocatellia bacterium]|nr:hypothetical protein [Blastocatellia bacterium]
MRITIEDSTVKAAAVNAVGNQPTPSTATSAIDAGAPAAALLQANFPPAAADGINAGAPPAELVQILQSNSSMSYAGEASSAGEAPTD